MKMHRSVCIALTLFLFSITCASGQQALLLQHKKKPGRKKALKLDQPYFFKAQDTVFHSHIWSFTDSTLTIQVTRRISDTTYTRTRRGKVRTITQRRYRGEKLVLSFNDIQVIKKDGSGNRWGGQAAAWVAFGGALGIVMLPVLAIQDGSDGVVDWLQFEGGVITLCGGFLLVDVVADRLKPRYNLVKRWNIKIDRGLGQP